MGTTAVPLRNPTVGQRKSRTTFRHRHGLQVNTKPRVSGLFSRRDSSGSPVVVLTRRSQRSRHPAQDAEDEISAVRLDKWLWAARFYKLRSLATEAVKHGQVSVNRQRPKPSRMVHVGDVVELSKAGQDWTVEVRALSEKRGPATEAQQLYRENEDSQKRRTEQAAQNRAEWLSRPQPPGHKPDKHERARLRRLLQKA